MVAGMKKIFRTLKRRVKSFHYTRAEKRHIQVGAAELWQMKREFQIKFLKASELKPQDFLLDIGCGTLRGGLPIIDYLQVGHYFGIDSRSDVLDEGQKELVEAGLQWKKPTLIPSPDISQLNIEKRFEFIWAFSVLIHMTDEILYNTLKFVNCLLLPSGVLFANVNIGANKEREWQGFPVVWRPLKFYQEACYENGLMLSNLGTLKNLGHISHIKSQDSQRMLKIQLAK
jgi:SAM-dependent methyltransferase